MKEIVISENEAGQRLDKFLGKYMNQAPKSFFYKMLRKKNIVLNGKKATGNEKLNRGDSVKLFLSDETIEKFSDGGIERAFAKLDIIYEDGHILLINKPAGMLSQKADKKDDSLVEYLITYLLMTGALTEEGMRAFRPSVCNRLDRNTSGLVAAGKTLTGLQEMGRLFRSRELKKYYRCLVKGQVSDKQYIKGWLYKDEKTNKVFVTEEEQPESLPIETEYRPVVSSKSLTLLEVHLITGRTHQIRAHLAAQGHPVIGDYKYGDRETNHIYREKYGVSSQLLHSYRMEFPQISGSLSYLSGKEFTADVPLIFENVIKGEL